MTHYLRTILASFCLTVCAGMLVLLPLSYRFYGVMSGVVTEHRGFWLANWQGQLTILWMPKSKYCDHWEWSSLALNDVPQSTWANPFQKPSFLGFRSERSGQVDRLATPHWFYIFMTGTLAVLLKPKPRLKFSIRDILIFTTVAAILIGITGVLADSYKLQ